MSLPDSQNPQNASVRSGFHPRGSRRGKANTQDFTPGFLDSGPAPHPVPAPGARPRHAAMPQPLPYPGHAPNVAHASGGRQASYVFPTLSPADAGPAFVPPGMAAGYGALGGDDATLRLLRLLGGLAG